MLKSTKARVLVLGLVIAAALAVFMQGRAYLSFEFWKQNLDGIKSIIAQDPLAWGCTYFAAYVVATALSLPVGLLFSLVSGALFGFGWGLVIASFASSIGADLSCALTRLLFADAVREKYSQAFAKIDSALQREGSFYLFAIRLNPAFPYVLTNWLMGLTNMPLWQFHLISQLGMLPAGAVYVNAGVQLSQIESIEGLISFPVVISLAILGIMPLFLKRYLNSKQ